MKNLLNKSKYIVFLVLVTLLFSGVKPSSVSADYEYQGFQWHGGSSTSDGSSNNNSGNLQVDTTSATNIDQDSATIRGDITEVNSNTSYRRYFEWGTSSSNLYQTTSVSGTTSYTGSFSATISGLNDNQNYYFRACVEDTDNGDYDCGSTRSFTTDNGNNNSNNGYLIASTDSATNVDDNSATLRGSVDDTDNQSVRRYFEWGTSSSNLYQTTSVSGTTSYTGSFSATISGLSSDRTYYFRGCIEDTNGNDYDCGSTRSFTTDSNGNNNSSNNNNNSSNSSANVITTEASGITKTTAILNGLVVNGNISQTIWFEWGATTSLGYVTSAKTVTGGQNIVSTQLSGLTPGQAYFFRLVSNNGDKGDFKSFITTKSTGSTTSTNTNTSTNITSTTTTVNTNIINSGEYLNVDLLTNQKEVKRGDTVLFTASYENISSLNLKNAVITVQFPEGVTAFSTSLGSIVSSQKIELVIPEMIAHSKGNFAVQAKVGNKIANQQYIVNVIEAVYNHPTDVNTSIDTLDYSIIKVVGGTSALSASVGSAGTFFPHSFFGWLTLVIFIIILVYLARKLYKKTENNKILNPTTSGALRISR